MNEKGKRKMSTILVKGSRTRKTKVIGYWATTTVIALELLAGGVTDLVHGGTDVVAGQPVVEVLAHLGYPAYLLTILGLWKLPASIALLPPGFPPLNECAYPAASPLY